MHKPPPQRRRSRTRRCETAAACSGCAGDYENPDQTAPDLESIESEIGEGDVEKSPFGDTENKRRHPRESEET
jgi:hypothetical protein